CTRRVTLPNCNDSQIVHRGQSSRVLITTQATPHLKGLGQQLFGSRIFTLARIDGRQLVHAGQRIHVLRTERVPPEVQGAFELLLCLRVETKVTVSNTNGLTD